MQKLIGVICLVGGVLLLVWGHNVAQSLGSQLNQAFTGSPSNKATYLYAAGAAIGAIGLFAIFFPGKK